MSKLSPMSGSAQERLQTKCLTVALSKQTERHGQGLFDREKPGVQEAEGQVWLEDKGG